MVAPQVLPAKFYALAARHEEYAWVKAVSSNDEVAGGSSLERDAGMYNWISLYRLDIDGDGLCDWFVVALAPLNTGGDSDVMNVLYLQTASGWKRLGPSIPENEPDELGRGNSDRDQARFLFGEDLAVVRDRANARNYLILSTGSRRASLGAENGYKVFAWNPRSSELEELDKWDSSSPASKAYEYFKRHGAWYPKGKGGDGRVAATFDPEIENAEKQFRCSEEGAKPDFCSAPAPRPEARVPDRDPLWGVLDEARYQRIRAKVEVVDLTDRRLNETYRERMKTLGAAGQSKLRETQRAWLRRRSSWVVGPQQLPDGTITIAQLVDRETVQIQCIRDFDPDRTKAPSACAGQH